STFSQNQKSRQPAFVGFRPNCHPAARAGMIGAMYLTPQQCERAMRRLHAYCRLMRMRETQDRRVLVAKIKARGEAAVLDAISPETSLESSTARLRRAVNLLTTAKCLAEGSPA
ncbi:MAG TPA: hypothetical protein PLS69_15655, partial [Terricaulis sp.]|nr:hypothetical protein [Terricaulis sp.]